VRILYAPRLGVVYHTGSVSVDLAWNERDRLARCYRGGLEAYALMHGYSRAELFRLTELVGASVRFAVYRVALSLRPGDAYLRERMTFYGWLARFYASSAVPTHKTSNVG
jgi:hypothetical protein